MAPCNQPSSSSSSSSPALALALAQASLAKQTAAAIGTYIQESNGIVYLTLYNITEAQFPLLKFLTISAILNPVNVRIIDFKACITYNNNSLVQDFTSLAPTLNAAMATASVSANVANATTYTPFGSSAFGSQKIGQLIDYASQTIFGYINTYGYLKTLRIVFEYSFGSNIVIPTTPTTRGTADAPIIFTSIDDIPIPNGENNIPRLV
jgi:hypothetical protein